MLSEILAATAGDVAKIPLPQEWWDFVRSIHVPEDIIADLAASSYKDWLAVGPIFVVPMYDLINQNIHPLKPCLDNGYLTVAGCRNFDAIVLQCSTRKMFFVFVDELYYPTDPQQEFSVCLQSTPYLYDDFWMAAKTWPDFPLDAGAALDMWPT